jgi:hypothetical protein
VSEPGAPASAEADARVLLSAAEVLRRRFGVLTAGDLIQGLTGAAAGLAANGSFRASDAGLKAPVIEGDFWEYAEDEEEAG